MKWLALLIISVVLTVSGAVVIGRDLPPPSSVEFLHFEACSLPCWIGIVPGRTRRNDAQQILEATYSSSTVHQLRGDSNEFQVTDPRSGYQFHVRLLPRP